MDERVLDKIQNKFGLLDHIIDKKRNADGFDVAEETEFERVFTEEEEEEEKPLSKKAKV